MKTLSPLAIVLLLVLPMQNLALFIAHTCDPDAPPPAFFLKIILPGLIPLGVYLFYSRQFFVAALAAVVPLECAFAWSAWHTQGEVAAAFLSLLIVFSNLIAALLFASNYRRAAIAGTVALALLIIPAQVVWLLRWKNVEKEVRSIIVYAEKHLQNNGVFPPDLRSYRSDDPNALNYIEYSCENVQFTIIYWVADRGTSHWYISGSGWGYHPD